MRQTFQPRTTAALHCNQGYARLRCLMLAFDGESVRVHIRSDKQTDYFPADSSPPLSREPEAANALGEGAMTEDRPFFRVFHVTRQQAAAEQIEGAIQAFYEGRFAIAITLAAAAEGMTSLATGGDLWESILSNPNRPRFHDNIEKDKKLWSTRLNESRDWLKHDKSTPNRNLAAVEAGIVILRSMDKWEPWSPDMVSFKDLWFSSPKLFRPEDYS